MDNVHGYGTGRIHAPDPRDQAYPIAPLLAAAPAPIVTPPPFRYHVLTQRFDQGRSGTCTGFGWAYWEACTPVRSRIDNSRGYALYRKNILVDEWTGNDREVSLPDDQLAFGSSVRAGAKVEQAEGNLREYRWAFSAEETALFILLHSGAIAGSVWQDELFVPTAEGFLKPRYDRRFPYGHAYFYLGYSQHLGAFRGIMAWRNFGQGQRFWMAGEDVQKLLDMNGEMCCPIQARR